MSGFEEAAVISRLLGAQRIAVVGLSNDPGRPSRVVSSYLREKGKQIIPVNPRHAEIYGEPCYPDLASIPGGADLALVFRSSDAAPDVVRDAIRADIPAVWLQQGICSKQARQLARDHNVAYIEDRCYKVEMMVSRR